MLEVHFGCNNGHVWQVATGAAVAPDQDTVSVPLAMLQVACPGCGLAAITLRIRLR